jgi:hypothetical protein
MICNTASSLSLPIKRAEGVVKFSPKDPFWFSSAHNMSSVSTDPQASAAGRKANII